MGAVANVRGPEFPVLLRFVDSRQEPFALFLPRHIEEELDYVDPVIGQVTLPVVDRTVTQLPDVFPALLRKVLGIEHLGVNAHHEHFLVVRSIEDPDGTARRQPPHRPPEEIMAELLRRRSLEGADLDGLRVDSAHDVFDGAVLAGGVEALQNDQEGVRLLRMQAILVLG